jgi:alkyl hydroperoxide reductase subunit AhpC
MIHPNATEKLTARSVVIIASDKKNTLTLTYPDSTGRKFIEILRVIDSLQLTTNNSVATPANWVQGEDVVILPSVPDADVPAKFPKGATYIKPYL